MRLSHIRLHDFRNVKSAELSLEGNRLFFHGPNAQGKTNLLEAAGLLSALRSFRTTEIHPLIRQGQSMASVRTGVSGRDTGETLIDIRIGRTGRKVLVDEAPVERFSDFIGRYPTVTISSADIQLLRGAPSFRRRFFDMVLSFGQPDYLQALRSYHKGLQERNALLKKGASDAELEAFDHILAPLAANIVKIRGESIKFLLVDFEGFYKCIANSKKESPSLRYKPSIILDSPDDFAASLQKNRDRDKAAGFTQNGPHRDDFFFLLNDQKVPDFASEGQQRAIVLSLRFAQFAYFKTRSGTTPVILADDILGELDPARRQRFWEACDPLAQILATGTSLPEDSHGWLVHQVNEGTFSLMD